MAEKQDELVVMKQSRLERLKEQAGEKIAEKVVQHQRGETDDGDENQRRRRSRRRDRRRA